MSSKGKKKRRNGGGRNGDEVRGGTFAELQVPVVSNHGGMARYSADYCNTKQEPAFECNSYFCPANTRTFTYDTARTLRHHHPPYYQPNSIDKAEI